MTSADSDEWLEGTPAPLDKAAFSRLIGYAPKDIDRWVREGAPTIGSKRRVRFVVADVLHWLLDRDGGDPMSKAKLRRVEIGARKDEIELSQMEARFADIDEVVKENRDKVAKLQADLLAIPARLAVPADVQQAVRAGIAEAINRLCEA